MPALATVCLATWFAYAPGLQGGFLFDDLVNLPALGATGPVDDAATFWRFVTSGTADPTGRPLALLSFLLDARDWPADPAPFLRTNLVLHLANGVFLFLLLRSLGRHVDGRTAQTDAVAILGAAMWMLHPLFVSTTLYIIQREAMLSAAFVLLGLLGYLHGRKVAAHAGRRGTAWMVASIGGGTLLAMLCKANGVLLPLLVWVLEATVLTAAGTSGRAPTRHLRLLLLVVPSVALFAWLLLRLADAGEAIAYRDWTVAERLLTQPRVLLDYAGLLFVPRAMSAGLFNDAFPVSTGLLQPWTTLPALLAVLAALAAGVAIRRRKPVVAAAILFFFAGHLLESTVLPLELHYEHRNYLPAMLAFWPMSRMLVGWKRPQWQRATIAAAALLLLGTTTWQRARVWGQPGRLALSWAAQNPASPRAQAVAAMAELQAGRFDLADRRLVAALEQHPRELQLLFNLVDARCGRGGIDAALVEGVSHALRTARGDASLAWRWLDRALDARAASCPGLDLRVLAQWIDSAAANPGMQAAPRRQDLAALRGKLALRRQAPADALRYFDEALAAWPTATAAAKHAALLGGAGHYEEALAHLDAWEKLRPKAPRAHGWSMASIHARVLDRQQYWPNELARLRRMLRMDLAARPAVGDGEEAGR